MDQHRVNADAAPEYPQARVLALYSFGMVIVQSCGQTSVVVVVGMLLHQPETMLRQRLREFYQDAADKRGANRQAVVVTTCFAPLLQSVLTWWTPDERRLGVAMDAMTSWVPQERQTAAFGAQRLIWLVDDLVAQPTASVPQACGAWAATKAAYTFWNAQQVTPEAIRAAHQDQTRVRVQATSTVLVIQDTTAINVTNHPATKDVGDLDHPKRRGL